MLLHIVNILVQTALKQTQVENYYGHFGRKHTNIRYIRERLKSNKGQTFTLFSIWAEKKIICILLCRNLYTCLT